jgi:predicted GIY-YIG superfamily endonuclease
MDCRLDAMKKRGVRKHIPTAEEPLDILIIDELLLLQELVKRGVDSPLATILSTGRKAGYVVWALSQVGQVDALGRVRDLFPQRICLATKSREMTEAALGPGAEQAGARCSQISEKTPGVGYMFYDGRRGFIKFRAVFIPDDYARLISQGVLPALSEMARRQSWTAGITGSRFGTQDYSTQPRRTAVYRLYSSDGRLLYVGITYNPNTRFQEHAAEKVWWEDVDMTKTEIRWYKNRKLAKKAETEAIATEHPVFNVAEAPLYDGDAEVK